MQRFFPILNEEQKAMKHFPQKLFSHLSLRNNLTDFLFPRTCAMCRSRLSTTEADVCASCLRSLHRVTYQQDGRHGAIERLFWGRIQIERATSFFYYDSQEAHDMIHAFKYFNRPTVAQTLGHVFAEEMSHTDFFEGVDGLVSLPLHWRKRLRRGYNQSDYIVKGLNEATGIPILRNTVKRIRNNPSQTHLTHQEREENVRGIFKLVKPELVSHRHILLVDDVLTTGSTLTSCAMELARGEDVRISIFTLAYAHEMIDFLIQAPRVMEYEFHMRPTVAEETYSEEEEC